MNHDRRPDSEIEQQRRDLDCAESGRRADADRERARDDASLGAERALADIARAAERALADAALAREKQARTDSDAALDHRIELDERRKATLREALALVEQQMAVVDGSLIQLLTTVPRGTFDGRLSEDVEKIRRAALRMHSLLEDVLDPNDARRHDHEVGGSG